MSRRRTTAIESFRNSLAYSLRRETEHLTEAKVRLGTWHCSAPLSELAPYSDVAMPMLLDLLVDYEFHPPEWTRLYFELEFVRIHRVYMEAVYRAVCEN